MKMDANESSTNRTQFYRNQIKSNQLKSRYLQMNKQQYNWLQNHNYFKQRKNWYSPSIKSGSRSTIAVSNRALVPKPVPTFNLLRCSLTTPVKQNPDIRRIVEAYQLTLGRNSNHYDLNELIPIRFDANHMLCESYAPHIEEVNQFVQRLDFLSTLPQNELNDNMKNWLNVMLLRSCWWFSFMDEEDMDMIRISGNYGLLKGQDKRLGPLFAFAQTITTMHLNVIEISLVSTYQLLMGVTTFTKNPTTNEIPLTAKRRDYVLKLLYSYQKELYPEDNLRYARLLTSLSELTYISIKI